MPLMYTDVTIIQETVTETPSVADATSNQANTSASHSEAVQAYESPVSLREVLHTASDSAASSDALTYDTVQWFYESVFAAESVALKSTTSVTQLDNAFAQDILFQLFEQLVSDQASGSNTWYLHTASMISEVAAAAGVASSASVANAALAEVIVALDLAEQGQLGVIAESVTAAEALVYRVAGVQAVLDAASSSSATSSYLIAFRSVADVGSASDVVSLAQAMTALVRDGATAFVRLLINGEVYTGWVLNTATGATSEYQGLQFNSLARIGDRYFGASETGVHELVGANDNGVAIATYVQTGLIDFGDTHEKMVPYAYLAADAEGRIALGVSASGENGVAQHWYEATMDNAAVKNLRIPVGRGLRGRHWKFEVASDALKKFDALTTLPVVLSRRV